MPYVFPSDLADEITARWQSFAAHQAAPPLPSPKSLRHILETAFFASFEREEGRAPRFVLCCATGPDVPRDGEDGIVPLVPLQLSRPLTVDAVRALAPAVSPRNAAMLVQCPAGDIDDIDACRITGVLHIGGDFGRARSGQSLYHRSAPFALTIDVRDAGELHVYQGGIKLAAIKAGRLQDQVAFSSLEFLPITDILARGERELAARVTPPAHEPPRDSSDFEWTALLATLLSVVNGIKEHGHGGTLLLVAPGSEPTLPVRLKYDVGGDVHLLAGRFAAFLNARHKLADVRWLGRATGRAADATTLSALQSTVLAAEAELTDAVDLIARLSAVDGALVLGADLRLLGFSGEIVLDAAVPVTAYEAGGHWGFSGPRVAVDSHSFGMRHRSALRCVSVAEGTSAFVVSQDGNVSFFWRLGQEVLLKRNVNTANPNMVGGW